MLRKKLLRSLFPGRRNASSTAPGEDCGKRVVVIGGGCAGLSAAHHLFTNGLCNVTVLEGSERLGGRILSGSLADTHIELGLKNLGVESITDPLYNLAVTSGIHIVPVPKKKDIFIRPTNGKVVTSFTPQLLLFDKIVREIPPGTQTPLVQYLHLRFQQELLHYPPGVKEDWETVLYGLANGVRLREGGDASSLPAWSGNRGKDVPGKMVNIATGNSSVLETLIAGLPTDKIRLNEEVVRVEWNNEDRCIRIRTRGGMVYGADYVIVTLPIGVLLETSEECFCPPLPPKKIVAMRGVSVTAKNVVHMAYDEPWWADLNVSIKLGWSVDEVTQEGNWAKSIMEITPVSSHVLAVVVIGSEGRVIEESSDEEVGMELTALLRKMMLDSTIPYPKHMLVSRWGTNRMCRGSYIGVLPQTKKEMLEELGKPVPEKNPVLLFAGDMTVPNFLGKVGGARISGIREADRILEMLGY